MSSESHTFQTTEGHVSVHVRYTEVALHLLGSRARAPSKPCPDSRGGTEGTSVPSAVGRAGAPPVGELNRPASRCD